MKWTDKRDVVILSTKHTPTMVVTNKTNQNGEPVVKPLCVLDYNANMGGVDRADQLSKYYSFARKTNKWWVKLLFYIVNLVVTNSYVLYLKNYRGGRPLTQYKFRRELARQMIAAHEMQRVPRGRPSLHRDQERRLTERHFPDLIPAKEGAKIQNPTRKCVVCNENSGKRHTPGESRKRRETRYWCSQCEKALCVVPCFERYHTLVNYKTQQEN